LRAHASSGQPTALPTTAQEHGRNVNKRDPSVIISVLEDKTHATQPLIYDAPLRFGEKDAVAETFGRHPLAYQHTNPAYAKHPKVVFLVRVYIFIGELS
jgi:hypothetical protein